MTILEERAKQIHTCAVNMKASAEKMRRLPTVDGLVVMTPAFVASLCGLLDDTAEIFDGLALCLED